MGIVTQNNKVIVVNGGALTCDGGGTADYKAFIERTITTPTLPSDLTTIAAYAFYNWSTLLLTSLPSGITSIGNSAFGGCTSLDLTSLPNGLTSIGTYAFWNCHSLTLSTIPSSVTSISSGAFQYCNSIETMTCEGALVNISGNLFTGSSTYPPIIREVYFPNQVGSVQAGAFGSTTVANACQQLEIADIGKATYIYSNAFTNCYKLQTLIIRKTGSICNLSYANAFDNTPMSGYNSLTGTVYVPNALISTYQTATNWKTLYDAGYITFVKIEGSIYE